MKKIFSRLLLLLLAFTACGVSQPAAMDVTTNLGLYQVPYATGRWDIYWRYNNSILDGLVLQGPAASITGEVVLFDGTTGKKVKRATQTGLAKLTNGVLSAAVANTDYAGVDRGVPVGVYMPYLGDTPPTGWLIMDGSAVSRTTYAALFAIFGTKYGAGNGSTTFNLPDMRNRVPVGASATRNLGTTGGEETHTLTESEMPIHTHTIADSGAHVHNLIAHIYYSNLTSGCDTGVVINGSAYLPNFIQSDGLHSHTMSAKGSGAAHNNMQPYLAANYIIKY